MAEKFLPPLAASPPDVSTIRTLRSQVHALERIRTKRPPGITGRPLSLIARELYGKAVNSAPRQQPWPSSPHTLVNAVSFPRAPRLPRAARGPTGGRRDR